MSDSKLVKISGRSERWAYPYRMTFRVNDTEEYLAEVLNGKLEFCLKGLKSSDTWNCRLESQSGIKKYFKAPQFLAENVNSGKKLIFSKSGYLRVKIDGFSVFKQDFVLSLGKKSQHIQFLNLHLEMDRDLLEVSLYLEDENLISSIVTIIYFVWARFARSQENW